MRCCATCFSDRQIRNGLISQCDPVPQKCDYCGTEDELCVEPRRLGQWFETLIATYESNPDGELLVDLLMREWRLFHNSGLKSVEVKDLLAEILDDGEIVRQRFSSIPSVTGGSLPLWDDLRDELMHVNRWFLSDPMDMDRIGELLNQLIMPLSELGDLTWYRARLMMGDSPYPLSEMGAPPAHLAGHGRANPAGIPYLYLGSTKETSVAELRPHTGEQACIAEFTIDGNDLKLADLRDPGMSVSPFFLDESAMIQLRADVPLLARLGDELTRPVRPSGAPFEYIPTQYLCEYIKTCGFDGVLYRSSVSSNNGVNMALFDPAAAQAVRVDVVSIDRVSVSIAD